MILSCTLLRVSPLGKLDKGYMHVCCVSRSAVSDFFDPMDCSLPGSSVHGILQVRMLEWVAMPSSRGSSQPRAPALHADSLPSEPLGP